jgi:hypothetical protein
VFVPLFLMGIETLEPVAGLSGGYGANIIHADYTHSLVGAEALSAVFGAAFAFRWGLRSGVVLALVSFSHWVLDLIVHRADMPLLPATSDISRDLDSVSGRSCKLPSPSRRSSSCAGAWLYYRAARSVSKAAGRVITRADIASLLILIGGLGVLALDASGILG